MDDKNLGLVVPTPVAESKTLASGLRFWTEENTERALMQLDVWASVHLTRAAGIATCPSFDSIFERPTPFLPRFQMHPNGPWHDDWEVYRKDSVAAARSAAEVVYLSTNGVLKAGDVLPYAAVLFRYFPRSGPYAAPRRFSLDEMSKIDRQIVWKAVSTVRGAWRGRR